MEKKLFSKRDEGFVCECCGQKVGPLGYTSRDHCTNCLCSKHVDVNPGDRQNECGGVLVPIGAKNGRRGVVIDYQCNKCGEFHSNKMADDDNFETMLCVMNKTYNVTNFEKERNFKEF